MTSIRSYSCLEVWGSALAAVQAVERFGVASEAVASQGM